MGDAANTTGRARAAQSTRFVRRWLATWTSRVAAVVLTCFVYAAVFAPFLASDRPLWVRGVELGRYESARTSLVPVTIEWIDLVKDGPSAWNARHPVPGLQTYAEAVASQRRAIDVRVATLRESLASQAHVALDDFTRRIEGASTRAELESLVTRVQQLSLDLRPAWQSESGGVPLATRTAWPLLSACRAVDAAWAVAACVVFVCVVSRRRMRTILVATALGFVVVLLVWRPIVGRDTGIVSYKTDVERGEFVVEDAIAAPIPFGPAETNLSEAYRAPTWLESSHRGTGATRGMAVPGSFEAEPLPVRVRIFEPAVDSPWRHVLGTDSVGRDLLARLVWGARASLFAGFASALILTCLGVAIGAWAGWRGGFVDLVLSRGIEIVLCFPAFVLVLCAVFFVDPSVVSPLVAVVVVIGLVGWPHVARLVRAECLRLRELEFVSAARALGLSERAIVWRHVLPNALPPAILAFAFAVGSGVLAESALSFLGFVGRADQPSWGALVADSRSPDHAWIWIMPGACIFALVASTNFLGEALRDALDPRHER